MTALQQPPPWGAPRRGRGREARRHGAGGAEKGGGAPPATATVALNVHGLVVSDSSDRSAPRPLDGQTLAGQVRFSTTELGELEAKIVSAGDRALGLELDIFERLTNVVTANADSIKEAAERLGQTVSLVKVNIHRGLRQLGELAQEDGHEA